MHANRDAPSILYAHRHERREQIALQRRLNGHKLKPGRYTLVATPTASGRTGRAINATFRIIY